MGINHFIIEIHIFFEHFYIIVSLFDAFFEHFYVIVSFLTHFISLYLFFLEHLLNTINASGISNHKIRLKVGVSVMLMRNMDPTTCLCNGTRLIITKVGWYVLEGNVITGSNIGDKVYIPILFLAPSDTRISFQFNVDSFIYIYVLQWPLY